MATVVGDPIRVHCAKCKHERILCYSPVEVDIFVALGKLPCGACGSRKVMMGLLPKPTNDGDAVGWLTNGDTGTSSMTIWSVMMGSDPRRSDYPYDPSDFGRCYRLLKVMPSWRPRLGEVADAYPKSAWPALVGAWDELTALYEEEIQNKNGLAPKLYARMQELRKATER